MGFERDDEDMGSGLRAWSCRPSSLRPSRVETLSTPPSNARSGRTAFHSNAIQRGRLAAAPSVEHQTTTQSLASIWGSPQAAIPSRDPAVSLGRAPVATGRFKQRQPMQLRVPRRMVCGDPARGGPSDPHVKSRPRFPRGGNIHRSPGRWEIPRTETVADQALPRCLRASAMTLVCTWAHTPRFARTQYAPNAMAHTPA
jgi:hypothetical protein